MPVFRPKDRPVDKGENAACGAYASEWLSQPGGLTQFGVIIETLPPGSASSINHWHSDEDELIYMLEGRATLIEGDTEIEIGPGDVATFRAGVALGHCLENRSDRDLRFLVVGTRAERDVVTYPRNDRMLHRDRGTDSRRWTDHAGNPAPNPYDEPPEG